MPNDWMRILIADADTGGKEIKKEINPPGGYEKEMRCDETGELPLEMSTSNEEISNPTMPTQTYTYIYTTTFSYTKIQSHIKKSRGKACKNHQDPSDIRPMDTGHRPANRPPKWGGDRRGGEANYFPKAI